jgi:dTDP-4-dehydrorhamnose 3,5-epimerase-like enzyme
MAATRPARAPKFYYPGEVAPASGVYKAMHVSHRPDHLVIAIRGEPFPVCRTCKTEVKFCLFKHVEYLAHDWDFTGPQ